MKDTICAISTPLGQGGIGIIRISGPSALSIGASLFKSSKNISQIKPYRLYHGYIKSSKGVILDEVLISYMPGPGSYTGEDVFEINCHGGPVVVKAVLEEVVKKGARLAKPGEFTMRAYLNNKIDLSKAEAILEIISCKGEKGLFFACTKLSGALKQKIDSIKDRLKHIMAQVVAEMDFDEEIEEFDPVKIQMDVGAILEEIDYLIENNKRYSPLMDGAKVVLCGEVNAGKSSILNAILGKERAIVTSIPGTTRDFIEETINIHGIPVKIIDTAGIRKSQDEIEIMGLKKGLELIKEADLMLLVFDISKDIPGEVKEVISLKEKNKIIGVANKIDISGLNHKKDDIIFFKQNGIDLIYVSAKTGENIKQLVDLIAEKITGNNIEPPENEIVPNLRQTEQLKLARDELLAILNLIPTHSEIDILYTHLENTVKHLQEITGEITTEDVLDRVFSNFCIGK
ncbi:tRNA uridine-5-carboxymethylaminomethyl(34) synthesis GTPase MnmE [Desulfothermus naphthae]